MKKEIAKQNGETAVAVRPDYLKKGDIRGAEDLDRNDIQLPRIALAQGLSPQIQKGDPKYIPGLELGDMFNTLTGEVFGQGPIEFTVVRRDKPRYVEFNPLERGGGVKDPNVPADDSRTQFGPNGEKPVATKFFDYVILMLPLNGENPLSTLIALSMKGTALKVARQLNTLMKFRNAPIFAGKYTLTAGTAKNSKGTFATYVIKNSEATDAATAPGNPGWVSPGTFAAAESVYENIKDRELVIDREDVVEEEDAPADM